jgi:3-oxoacyl-(acyl-carrier-protein) synthase
VQHPISITAIASISPLGNTSNSIWEQYLNRQHCFNNQTFSHGDALVAAIPKHLKQDLETLRQSDNKYKSLDNSVLFAIYASRQAVENAGWETADNFGINIGSSRGATALFETYHQAFLERDKVNPLSSPTTTLGNISSWVAHDLQTKGPEISHSITCSTALHALLNGIAWLQAGMCDKFLVGGSEAPLTSFSVAQMQALKIYAKTHTDDFPCKALDVHKTENTMILGEGASIACLESGTAKNALAYIEGMGYATEILEHNASLSTNAHCFQSSMKMALNKHQLEDIDIIITHTPGTVKGDQAEMNAIKAIFGNHIPALTTNKWKVGHTLGTSGMLSIELAVLMLKHQQFIETPLYTSKTPTRIQKILVNAVGFGGNAVSILISK